MDMSIATPSLLFPAISLLMLAYTNRFVTLTNVIRQFGRSGDVSQDLIRRQLNSFRIRLQVIRSMQVFGVLSFVMCTLSMFALYLDWVAAGQLLFGGSLLFLLLSLLCSLYEVHISTQAINMEIENMLVVVSAGQPASAGCSKNKQANKNAAIDADADYGKEVEEGEDDSPPVV